MNVFKKVIAIVAAVTIGFANVYSGEVQPLIANNTIVGAEEGTGIAVQSDSMGVVAGTVECFAGEKVEVPLCIFGVSNSVGCELTVSVDSPLSVEELSRAMVSWVDGNGIRAVYVNGTGYYPDNPFGYASIYVPDDIAPGTYPVNITVYELDDGNGGYVENPVGISGAIVVAEPLTPEPTAPIEPPKSEYLFSYNKVDEDDDWTYDYIEITYCDESAVSIEIPPEIGGLPVKKIGYGAFRNCVDLKNITIPDSVTSIEGGAFGGAFKNCTSLEGIIIPDSVTSIGNGVFKNCSSLKSVTIPDSVTSIEMGAFEDCTSLEGIIIPNSVTSIGYDAFKNCSNLKSIEIPESVTEIRGDDAFDGCTGLISINVADNNSNYSSLNGVLFNKEKTKLIKCPESNTVTEYTVPNGVTSISSSAFYSCTNLTSITIPDGVTDIGTSAFSHCINLESVSLPYGIKSIWDFVFYGCSNLKNINIPESVEAIGWATFADCTSLENIKLPESLKFIEGHCDYYSGKTAFENTAIVNNQTGPVYYVDKWAVGCDENVKSVEIADGTVGIEVGAFFKNESILNVKIPGTVKRIDHATFYGASELKEVTIENGVELIGQMAFIDCSSLEHITIPKSITTIVYGAFAECENLTSMTIENPECEIYDAEYTISNGHDDNYKSYYNGIICGYENSTAQAYANDCGYKFESIGEKPPVTIGDLNADGEITVADIVKMQKYLVNAQKLTKEQWQRADMNSDGTVNVFDVIILKRRILKSN